MKYSKIIYIAILISVSAFILHSWLSFGYFSTGDWEYHYSEKLSEYLIPTSWEGDKTIGSNSIVIWNFPARAVAGLLGITGSHWNMVEKYMNMWQIVFLLPIVSYFLLGRIHNSYLYGFFGSIVLLFNSYFLSIYTQGHIPLVNAGVWGMLSLYFLMHARDDARARWAVLAGMVLAIAGYYDFRLAYIFLGVGVLYFLWEWVGMRRGEKAGWIPGQARNDREGAGPRVKPGVTEKNVGGLLRLFGVFVAVFVGLNVFWILPFGAAEVVGLENAGMGRDLFGNDAFELDDVMYLSHPFWTGYGVKWFSDQATPWWLSILGVLAWVGFWVGRKNRTVVFFALLSVLGILLGKQVSEPWGNLYYFLYDHVPGFNAFREASKFYILVVLGYAVGIGALVERILANQNPHPSPLPEGEGEIMPPSPCIPQHSPQHSRGRRGR